MDVGVQAIAAAQGLIASRKERWKKRPSYAEIRGGKGSEGHCVDVHLSRPTSEERIDLLNAAEVTKSGDGVKRSSCLETWMAMEARAL